MIAADVDVAAARSGSSNPATTGGNRKKGSFSKSFADVIATVAAHKVASSAVPTIAVGRVEPAEASNAIAVAGINCTDAVLIARKVHIALDATVGRGFNCSRSRIARRPSGVAAVPR